MIELDELRAVERAEVLKGGVRAAYLTRRPDGVEFSYDPRYLTGGGPPVATTLPVSSGLLRSPSPGALPPFFSGLLPEGRRLTALRNAVKTSADDEFTLLLAVGGDPVGDVQVVPEGTDPVEVEPTVSTSDRSALRFGELFAASVGGDTVDRVAIPGVQEKVSARMIGIPVASQGARFILKLDPPEFPHLVANEAFFFEAARHSGLETAEAEVVTDAEGAKGLLVGRFDRAPGEAGRLLRFAQEDACQVLGRYPADKYRMTTEAVVGGLAGVCRARPVAALQLLKQVAFAYLSCYGDAHAKNLSVLRAREAEWRVTPAYDLPSSHPYGDTTMALTINGKRKEDIGRGDFIALGGATGVRPRAVTRALDELCDRVDSWINGLEDLPFDEGRVRELRRAIEYRRGRLGGVRVRRSRLPPRGRMKVWRGLRGREGAPPLVGPEATGGR